MSEDRQHKSQGILGFIFDELRGAIQDIRQKVVEEGWFGRVVSAAPVVEMDRGQTLDRPDPDTDDAGNEARPSKRAGLR